MHSLHKIISSFKTVEPMKRLLIVITVAVTAFIFSCNPSKTTTTNSSATDTTNTMQTDTTSNMNNTDTTHHR